MCGQECHPAYCKGYPFAPVALRGWCAKSGLRIASAARSRMLDKVICRASTGATRLSPATRIENSVTSIGIHLDTRAAG